MLKLALALLVIAGPASAFLWWVRSPRGWAPGEPVPAAVMECFSRLADCWTRSNETLRRNMWRSVKNTVRFGLNSRGLVPSAITVRLHPDDLALLDGMQNWVCGDLSQGLVTLAEKMNWDMPTPPMVVLSSDDATTRGKPDAVPSFIPITEEQIADAVATTVSRRDLLVGIDGSPTLSLSGATELSIGRRRSCDLVLDDSAISRRHAVLRLEGDTWTITDADSRNGVKVNGKTVESAPLAQGDTIQLSQNSRFTYTDQGDDTLRSGTPAPDDTLRSETQGSDDN